MSDRRRPFEVSDFSKLEEGDLGSYVERTVGDLQSNFMILPRGEKLLAASDLTDAVSTLSKHTDKFLAFTPDNAWAAVVEDSRVLLVLRTMLGFTPSEWAALARAELKADVDQGQARSIDASARTKDYVKGVKREETRERIRALVVAAVQALAAGATGASDRQVHRLGKTDTKEGVTSIARIAEEGVPYAALLYERYLGRPFASYRDSISELVGDIIEVRIEEMLLNHRVPHHRTGRAERIEGWDQAPDFLIPSVTGAVVAIEAKMAEDDGTARDKTTRIMRLAQIRDEQAAKTKQPPVQLVACIDGRGFGERAKDMQRILAATQGKTFTLVTLDQLIVHTRIAEFVGTAPEPTG